MARWEAVGTPGLVPVIRVRQMRENLAALDCFEPELQARIRARLADTVGLIEDAPSSSWLPIEVDAEVAETVGALAGVEGARRWGRRGLQRSFGAPFLQSIVRGAVGVFGLDPAKIVRFVPRGVSNIYRNCGTWEAIAADGGFVDLRWSDPPASFASKVCKESFAGALEAIFEALDRSGTVTLRRDGDALVFELRWV
ncbi:MAG: hypothetical protein ACE37F_23085 [Nannocystaceae bacterium]|nr:hypothetical protein [bacterium]